MYGGLALLATIGAALSIAVLPTAALAVSPAKVQIEPAEQTPTGFKLKAKVNPEGSATTYYFIYKQVGEVECEDLEGCGPETPKGGPLTGDTQQEVQAEVTGLTPGTNYVYWLIAHNAFSEDVRSASLGFTTPPAPSIESESVSYVTHNDATLEATINSKELPEGAYYQFQLVKNPSEYLPQLTCPEPEVLPPSNPDGCTSPDSQRPTPGALPIGYIAKGPQGQSVSLDMATAGVTLQPNTTYHYRVLAAKRVQSEDGVNWQRPFVENPDQTFTTLPPSTPPSEVLTGLAEPTPTGYDLNGKLNPDGLPTTYYYEYIGSNEVQCLDIEPGLERCWHETAHLGPITGDTQQELPPVEVTGLTVGVTYHYRLVATNADRTVFGHEASFTVGSPPSIDAESVSHVTERDATLEAQIDTEGLATLYQFRLSAICGGKGACLVVVNYPLPSGLLLGSFVDQSVSLDLNTAGVTLQPGGTYTYSVSATNASGTTESAPHNFTTPENAVQPLSTTTSLLSGAGPPASSNTNSSDQPTRSGGSPAPGVTPLGSQIVCLCNCARGCHGKKVSLTRTQNLSKVLKACDKKPKKQRPSCRHQAEKKYSATSKHRA
jgi:hypothetical protein